MINQYLYVSFSKRAPNKLYLDASVRYRCVFPAEYLAQQNITAHCIHYSQLKQIQLHDYSRVICHRPRYSRHLKSLLKLCKMHDIVAISDWDDLLFNPSLAKFSPAYLSGQLSFKQSKTMASEYQKALRLFKNVTVSTDKLKEQVLCEHPDCTVSVIYNQLPARWASPHIFENETDLIEHRLKNKTIYYFPGTAHHASNFHHVSRILASYLHQNPSINLNIVGTMSFDQSIFPSKQIRTSPFVMFEDLPNLIKQAWVSISPLEENIFNECKSGLKFWESGLLGVPVISNHNLDMSRFNNIGLLQSNDLQDWEAYLDKLQDKDFYTQASAAAYTTSQHAKFSFDNRQAEPLERKELQTILTAKIGSDWPLALLSPTHKKYSQANSIINSILKVDTITHLETIAMASNNKRSYLASTPSNFKKIKKLKNNPKLFLKDMLKNIKQNRSS